MKKKLIRITTADISLDGLLKGQLRYMNQYYDVVALSNDTGCLHSVGEREGVRTIEVPMHREIALLPDLKCLCSTERFAASGLLLSTAIRPRAVCSR